MPRQPVRMGGIETLPPQKLHHVVIIFQENRTPDNLFHGLPNADIADNGINSHSEIIPLAPADLAGPYDLDHSHPSFLAYYDNGKMDGADTRRVGCVKRAGSCPPPNPQYVYVPPAEVTPYFDLAEQYTFADRMFQTDQGPSFPAHQFIISGTSAPQRTVSCLLPRIRLAARSYYKYQLRQRWLCCSTGSVSQLDRSFRQGIGDNIQLFRACHFAGSAGHQAPQLAVLLGWRRLERALERPQRNSSSSFRRKLGKCDSSKQAGVERYCRWTIASGELGDSGRTLFRSSWSQRRFWSFLGGLNRQCHWHESILVEHSHLHHLG